MNINKQRWLGFFLLLVLLLPLGWLIIPSHWTSLWMDMEFTDWISPIANRLHDGARLYQYGLHSPMPPIPYVFLHVLWPQQALWIEESFLNFSFQAAMLLTLYLALSRKVAPGVAFVVLALAIPLFFCFHKTILYDSMAQFFVVVCALGCTKLVQPAHDGLKRESLPIRWLALEGLWLALMLLTKQSTGMGVVLGVSAALVLLPRPKPLQRRLIELVMLGTLTGGFLCLLGWLMTPWVDFPGMVKDVFIIGSEPKGGARRILPLVFVFSGYVALAAMASAMIVLLAAKLFAPRLSWSERRRDIGKIFELTPTRDFSARPGIRWMVITLFVSLAGFVFCHHMSRGGIDRLAALENFLLTKAHIFKLLLYFGLGLATIFTLLALWKPEKTGPDDASRNSLAPLIFVFLPAAIFHLLSVGSFRWAKDNNPIIVMAMLYVIGPLLELTGGHFEKRQRWAVRLTLAITGLILLTPWLEVPFDAMAQCTVTWPEVRQLSGARMRPGAEGMRSLVGLVRQHVSAGETVLLLPNDPNVEAWFERDRPLLACANIFTDQYWDRYVEIDFQTLTLHPPKVIVIGPRDYWQGFSRIWNTHHGAERLIEMIQTQLLPTRYELIDPHPIRFEKNTAIMDVYLRRD